MGLLQVAAINSAMSSLIKTITVRATRRHMCMNARTAYHRLIHPLTHHPPQTHKHAGLHQGAAHRDARAVQREGRELRPGALLPLQAGGGAARHGALVRSFVHSGMETRPHFALIYSLLPQHQHAHSPVLFGCIMYPLAGLQMNTTRFLKFLGILVVESYAAAGFGMVRACARG